MAQPNYVPVANPVSVIGSQFTVPYPIHLLVTKNASLKSGNLVITDLNNNIMLKVNSNDTSFHHQRLIVDAHGKPIMMLREKLESVHDRWKAFRGDSKDDSNLIFSTKTPHMFQFSAKVDVFLAKNTEEDHPDFKIEGKWSDKGCTIYAGDSSMVVAQMHKKHPGGYAVGKYKFIVTVYPSVDYAFVVALIAVLDAMKNAQTEALVDGIAGGTADGIVGGIVGGIFAS